MITFGIQAFLVKLEDPLRTSVDAKSAALAQILIKSNFCHIKTSDRPKYFLIIYLVYYNSNVKFG